MWGRVKHFHGGGKPGEGRAALSGGHSQGAVQADDLTVQEAVGDDMFHQLRVFGRAAKAGRIWDAGTQAVLDLLGQTVDHGRVEQAWGDRDDADSGSGEFPGGGKGHADDASLRSGIGGLANLALVGGDGGGVDDDSPLVFVQRAGGGHFGGGKAQHIEAADQVDTDDAFERFQRQGTVSADNTAGG